MKRVLRIATRKSPLALWQAEHIQQLLKQLNPDLNVELLPLSTKGDRFLSDSLLKIGGKGLFVKELEQAMLAGSADLAVHSMKDVPVEFPQGLTLNAIIERATPYDALISNRFSCLDDLPEHAVIGTSSLRRKCQLLAYRPDLHVKNLRGNVNTRLAKLDQGLFDAIILAEAGLNRLNLQHRIREVLPADIMLPACGQGALGIECRKDDAYVIDLCQHLNCSTTRQCVEIERSVNADLGGNCHAPVAVYCDKSLSEFRLKARVGDIQSRQLLNASASGENSIELGHAVSHDLIASGALELIKQCQ